MRRKSMSKKVIALTLLATMVAPQVAYGKEITKDEAVYVTMDPSGKVDKRIVSNWVHSNNGGEIKDKSILKDIKNIKGDEKPTISGENITWSVKGNDVYYQGTTDKELPLSVKLKYYLDGKEITPQDISGKSGKFKISLDFVNNETHNVAINGVVKTIYTPIAAAAVVNLPDKYFKNIKTSGGSIVSDGNNNIVTLAALPGMKKSLGLDELDLDLGIDLKDSIDIEGDVDNFQLGAIMVTATPKLGELKELSSVNKLEDLRKALGDLKDASNKLADGGKKLSDGVNLASSKLQEGMKQLNSEENKKKLSLMTDQNKVNLSRKLVDDALIMEKMDTSLLESASGLMTKDNIALGNKVYKDVNEIKFENILKSGLAQKLEKFTLDGNFDKNLKALNDLLGDKALLDSQLTPEKLNSLYGLLDLLTDNIGGLQSIMKTSLEMSQADLSSLGAVNGLLSQADAINAKLDAVNGYAKELATLKATLDGMTKQVQEASQGATKLNSEQSKATADDIVNIIKLMPESQVPQEKKVALVQYMMDSKEFIGEMADTLPNTEKFMQGASIKLDEVNKELTSPQNVAMIAQLKALMAKENIQKIQGMLQGLQQSQKLLKDNAKTLGALNQVAGSVKKEDLIKVKELSMKLMGDLQNNKDNVDLLIASLQTIKDPKTMELVGKLKVVQGDLKALEPTMQTLNKNMTPENIKKIMATPEMLKQLLDMKQDLVKSDDILNTTKEALAQGNVDKAKTLLSKAPDLIKGLNELNNGATMLSDNLSKFNTEGVGKLNSEGTEKLDKVKKVADSANELVKISNNYGAFSGITDNMDSKVKFIYKTQEIKGKEIKQEVKEEKKEEKKGFFAWIKSVFSK